MPKTDQRDFIDWDAGREGYVPTASSGRNHTVYSGNSARTYSPNKTNAASIRREERFGSLVAAAGIIWGIYMATQNYESLWHFDISKPGPLEVCALGILAWLHAKWRRSLKSG